MNQSEQMSLSELRAKIDEADQRIIEAIEDRMDVAAAIAA